MKTIIAGSRRITDPDIVERAIEASGFIVTSVIEGGQRTRSGSRIVGGVDWLARLWGLKSGKTVQTINADWDLHGKAAGPIRNGKMLDIGEQLIAIPDEESKGTRDIISQAEQRGMKTFVFQVTSTTPTLER